MGAIATIIANLSDDFVAALAAAGYPPLTSDASGNAGAFLVGTAAAFEQTSAPRVIFEPTGSKFSALEYSSASSTLDTLERRNQAAMRTIASEAISFDVRVWGVGDGTPVDDYDVTRAMYHQIRASMQSLIPGAFSIEESGTWTRGTNVNLSGREFVFGVTIMTPILDALIPYAVPNRSPAAVSTVVENLYAPDTTVPVADVVLDDATDEAEEV